MHIGEYAGKNKSWRKIKVDFVQSILGIFGKMDAVVINKENGASIFEFKKFHRALFYCSDIFEIAFFSPTKKLYFNHKFSRLASLEREKVCSG